MKVRIISGEFGGRTIDAPEGKVTHPMSERVRGSLFNIIGDKIKGVDVLDAFAGTGALGIEALSRGAKSATFVERDKVASRILNHNIDKLDVGNRAKVNKMGVNSFVENYNTNQYDVIFTDPPYNDMQLSTVSRLASLLSPSGIMVLSYPGSVDGVPPEIGIVVVDNRSYGTASLAIYQNRK